MHQSTVAFRRLNAHVALSWLAGTRYVYMLRSVKKDHHMLDPFSRRLAVLALMLSGLIVSMMTAACHRAEKLPDPSSQEYRDTVRAFYVGLAALQAGDDRRAEDELTRAAQLAPGEPATWANLGMLSLKGKDFDIAAQRLEKAAALAPNNSRIVFSQANLASSRGNPAEATRYLRRVIELDPKNLKAIYSLAGELETQGGDKNDAEAQRLMQRIVEIQPDNLAVRLELIRLAAKRGDTATLQSTIAGIAADTASWPPEAREQLGTLQNAASTSDMRLTGQRVAFLRNVLVRFSGYRTSLASVKLPPGEINEPFIRFLKLPSPSPLPAAMDDGLAFTLEPLPEFAGAKWSWVAAVSLDGEGPPAVVAASASRVRVKDATLSFPGGASATPPSADGVLALDFDYDFKTDLALAGAGGFRLYRQEPTGAFTDVSARLPASITARPYWGAWAADVEMDGNLDIVLAAVDGPPVVLRNNGDGTFTEVLPFEGITNVRGFAWADLDGDGAPDAVLLSADGKLHIFTNERAGLFRPRPSPADLPSIAALGVADVNGDGVLDLIAAQQNGALMSISDNGDGTGWTTATLADPPQPALAITDFSGRIIVADLDNNGASDLICSTPSGTAVWLSDPVEKFRSYQTLDAQAFSAADLTGNGMLDLAGVSKDGQAVRLMGRGTKGYHWQTIRPRAATTSGAQRINTFGIGGEMEVRSGLLFQKQSISSPLVHFGLGQNTETDVLRIVWPNGTPQAEFELGPDQAILTNQRLKGSCPSLFAFDGTGMRFVKDCAPWTPVIGVRINDTQTEPVSQTEEWVKIPGNQLVPRDGYYDLRITAELWESYYIDHYSLMVVDHPESAEMLVDERSASLPPPKLGIYMVGRPQPIKGAWDDLGHDVTNVVSAVDGRCLDTFQRGPYRGAAKDHYVEMDLGDDLPSAGPAYLIASGWTIPTDATANLALSEAGLPLPKPLSLEVQNAAGKWVVARDSLGCPAGKNKTILINLDGVFRPGAPRRLRLRTSMEIYWDALQWASGLPQTEIRTLRLNPDTAELRYRGFSVMNQPNKLLPDVPDYDRIATTSQRWRDLTGYYTRYGDIRALLQKVDDRVVIVNAGDEMLFRFAAPPAPPPGWLRDFVFIGNGWIKDGDPNSMYSQTLLPLPSRDRTEYTDLPARLEDDPVYRRHPSDWQEYHTRYVTPDRFQRALTINREARD
jgi:Tfp pilus assembly protein PilF